MSKNVTTVSKRPGNKNARQLSDQDVAHLLLEIQQKVSSSPALNGGFDTLLYKVDKIEESQGQIVQTVASIHEAIYNPDTGIFSRIAGVKASQAEDRSEIDKKFIELNAWKTQTDKIVTDDAIGDSELQKKVETQQKTIENLERWKSNVSSVGKWSLATIGGGTITILLKALYDFVSS